MPKYYFPIPCPYNSGVVCADQEKCSYCGWNPEVVERRKQKIKEKQKKGE